MFTNIGKKIMGLAQVVCWIGIVFSFIGGAILMDEDAAAGLITMAVGALFSWVGSFVLYGFGRLVENSSVICRALGHPTEMEPPVYGQPYAPQNYGYAPQQPYMAPGQNNPQNPQ